MAGDDPMAQMFCPVCEKPCGSQGHTECTGPNAPELTPMQKSRLKHCKSGICFASLTRKERYWSCRCDCSPCFGAASVDVTFQTPPPAPPNQSMDSELRDAKDDVANQAHNVLTQWMNLRCDNPQMLLPLKFVEEMAELDRRVDRVSAIERARNADKVTTKP